MGNGLSPCTHMPATATMPVAARLVYWGGQTRLLPVTDDEDDNGSCSSSFTARDVAAELVAEHIVCAAESFFVGLPIPVVAPAERLLPGRAYFVLPAARFSAATRLTAATLASLAPPGTKKKTKNAVAVRIAGPGQCPFEYVKGAEDGAAPLIRVLPEFIEKVIGCSDGNDSGGHGNGAAAGGGGRPGRSKSRGAAMVSTATETDELCSTPELKRHYAQLVGARSRPWSPPLETISERGKRRALWSLARLLLSSR
ncbi:uncharacterized protein LOC100821494 [Brachypodium distachyon]|uniref:Uncharacterized protein n=1 Tax=Brachypodium distachyon TaxID=15368 RepID=I1HVA0_BRADI|nr:uncharacterized protein LOC100821494 [Brachypodium distachyon]KQK11582.1 hypothetical protein BRADI_2g60980v3 [Brachypodium distachyon]|eukprot:XP_003567483.1 uncharacterized protein LOC100821494 [Brachypodium distachyon]